MSRTISVDVTATIEVVVPDAMDDTSALEEIKKRINTHLELNDESEGGLQIQDVSINRIGDTVTHN